MKRLTQIMAMVAMALCTLTLAGCTDDDEYRAYTLEGTWKGDMYVTSTYNGVTYDATYSELCFLRDPYRYSSGQGYWIDYYSYAPWDYVANHIEWTVQNGVISIWLIEENSYVDIYDYYLDDDYFAGTIYYGNTVVDFRLRHVSSPNWNDYEYGWDYWYAKPATMMKAKASADSSVAVEKPVRGFRSK
ncbi:MAG: hepatitis A virus cellular receptor 1 [Prevotella sp.]|nr:hepatitis A virus cellular receptor 1 [Prevotella sp.]